MTKYAVVLILLFAACTDSVSPTAACERVGTSFCAKMYACYSAAGIAGFHLPATEQECVTKMNANCGAAQPAPGYCEGQPQVSTGAATACADEFDSLTCQQLMQPTSSGACKTELCMPSM
jgi:hypothetical protein